MTRLDGRVAVVTGAGRGIGRGEALLLAELGASVVVNDVGATWNGDGGEPGPADDVVAEIVARGGRAVASYADISTWGGAAEVVTRAVEELGRLDIVVNNAGILRDRLLVNLDEEHWNAVVRCHLNGHAGVTHHACRYWVASGRRGRIVNTTSESAFHGIAGQAAYAAAKAGIVALTAVTAVEMADHGVTANAIAPRARTRLITESLGPDALAPGARFDEFAPENIAPLVAYLVGPYADGVTGQCFVVSGGTIELLGGRHAVGRIAVDHRWDVDELACELPALLNESALA